MSKRMVLLLLLAAATTVCVAAQPRWYKGNLHTHTLNSDGDSTPHEVATWYREHGYQFLVLSDHNYLTDPAGLNAVVGAPEKFLLIPGEEVSDSFEKKPVHLNAYNLGKLVPPQQGTSVSDTIRNNVNAIRQAGAVAALNHPNFRWAVSAEDMLAVKELTHVEVFNGHPSVNNLGGGGSPSLDQMWDTLLTAGRRVYGVATDDAHHFKKFGAGDANPGRGWVCVRAESLTADSIARALAAGDFYASNGVKLSDVRVSPSEYSLEIDRADWEKTTTYFIGAGGKVLATSFDRKPSYRPSGTEGYVRARVESSTGAKAWTQPLFLGPKR